MDTIPSKAWANGYIFFKITALKFNSKFLTNFKELNCYSGVIFSNSTQLKIVINN